MDYYKILGVDKNATADQIKKAFHKLAHKHHPDKSGGDAEKFKEINRAYGVLSDTKKRADYDRFGEAGEQAGGFNASGFSGFSQGTGSGGFSGFDFGQSFDFGDIFGDFFEGFGQRAGSSYTNRQERGRDVQVDLEISFVEMALGTQKNVSLFKMSRCGKCHGKGAEKDEDLEKCSICRGTGKVEKRINLGFGSVVQVVACASCAGKGFKVKKKCSACHGTGINKEKFEVQITIPAGVEDGNVLRMSGQGEESRDGMAGDLFIKIHVLEDARFRRIGQNILVRKELKLTEALLGTVVSVPTIKGEKKIEIPPLTAHGAEIKITGEGIRPGIHRGGGDEIVKIRIKMPARMSARARELLEELEEEGL